MSLQDNNAEPTVGGGDSDSRGGVENSRRKRKAWVWIMLMVNIVFLLTLMTLGIIALKVGNYLPSTDIVFIVGKKTDVEVGDEETGAWHGNENLNIFSTVHKNADGQITVESENEDKVIAPGTDYEYQFTIYNNGNVAISYIMDIDFAIRVAGVKVDSVTEKAFPLKLRLLSQSEEYIMGDSEHYMHIEEAAVLGHRRILGAESYETFTLELMWDYDEDDANDTALGNIAAEDDIVITLVLDSYAEEHIDAAAEGGIALSEKKTEIGGSIRWVWMLLLIINTAVIIFYVSWLMNKRLEKW